MNFDQMREMCLLLVCPQSKLRLELVALDDAEKRIGAKLQSRPDCKNSKGRVCKAMGRSEWVLLREDGACAYPIIDGIPILLVPEMLKRAGVSHDVDLCKPQYAEAYDEMEFYNEEARIESQNIEMSEGYKSLKLAINATMEKKETFPRPGQIWVDAVYDCVAQAEAYEQLSPLTGKRLMQLGGKGLHAVKFLIAGVAEAWSATPMLGEVLCGRALAQKTGVDDRFRSVVAVAEELPFVSEAFDGIYSGGCLHHMQMPLALPEIVRVLRMKGVFVAVEPWRAPFYALGTQILGKRETGAYCTPLTKSSINLLFQAFREAKVTHHGALTRYPLLALGKIGVKCGLSSAWHLTRMDDMVSSYIPGVRSMGSSIVVQGVK